LTSSESERDEARRRPKNGSLGTKQRRRLLFEVTNAIAFVDTIPNFALPTSLERLNTRELTDAGAPTHEHTGGPTANNTGRFRHQTRPERDRFANKMLLRTYLRQRPDRIIAKRERGRRRQAQKTPELRAKDRERGIRYYWKHQKERLQFLADKRARIKADPEAYKQRMEALKVYK
jgi:hypothetical protein